MKTANGPGVARLLLRGGALLSVTLLAGAAHAQDDGARVYQLAPSGAQAFTSFAVAKRGNEAPESGDVIGGSQIDTNILVFRYVQTFSLWGRQFSPFAILPTGQVRATVHGPNGRVSDVSSGLGDAQIGGVLGLFGSPALPPDEYARFRPHLGTGLLARVFFPTGDYSPAKPVNLGANRFAYQLGLPSSYAVGRSYLDPELMTFDLLPTITFYDDNARPYGAQRVAKAPLFSVEGHATRNLSPTVWLSADVLYRQGGETTTDSTPDHNPTQGWSAGMTAALRLNEQANLILTYEHVVERNDQGPDGWFLRAALVIPFR